MAVNERLVIQSGDIPFGQMAPSKIGQTNFTPGITNGKPLDMNWPKDFRIPTGNPAFIQETGGPDEVQHTRIIKLHRNSVSDQTVLSPTVEDVVVETVTDAYISGTHQFTKTQYRDKQTEQERKSGDDRLVGQ